MKLPASGGSGIGVLAQGINVSVVAEGGGTDINATGATVGVNGRAKLAWWRRATASRARSAYSPPATRRMNSLANSSATFSSWGT